MRSTWISNSKSKVTDQKVFLNVKQLVKGYWSEGILECQTVSQWLLVKMSSWMSNSKSMVTGQNVFLDVKQLVNGYWSKCLLGCQTNKGNV